jgi:hypothetical protein
VYAGARVRAYAGRSNLDGIPRSIGTNFITGKLNSPAFRLSDDAEKRIPRHAAINFPAPPARVITQSSDRAAANCVPRPAIFLPSFQAQPLSTLPRDVSPPGSYVAETKRRVRDTVCTHRLSPRERGYEIHPHTPHTPSTLRRHRSSQRCAMSQPSRGRVRRPSARLGSTADDFTARVRYSTV